MNALKAGSRALLKNLVGRQSTVWNRIKSPQLRYRAFNDILDTLIYALSSSRDRVFFIQVGSNDATDGDPLRPFLGNEHWYGIMIEPVNYVFKRLAAKYGRIGRFTLENVAIAEVNGKKEFYYIEESNDALPVWYDQLGSFSLETIKKCAEAIPGVEERIRTTMVESITFQELCKRNSVKNIDLLHIDTEGFDYEILKLVDFEHHRPVLILYEHKHLSKSDGGAAEKLLMSNGYEVTKISNADTIAISSERLEVERLLKDAWNLSLNKVRQTVDGTGN